MPSSIARANPFPPTFVYFSLHRSIRRRALLTGPPPLHIPHALIRRVEDALVKVRRNLDAVQRITCGPASDPARFVPPHGDDVLAAFVAAAALPAQGS